VERHAKQVARSLRVAREQHATSPVPVPRAVLQWCCRQVGKVEGAKVVVKPRSKGSG